MNELSMTALIVGGVLAILYMPLIAVPAKALAWLRGFSRNAWMGRILTFIALAWVAWLLKMTPLGGLERYRMIFYILVPIFFGLIVCLMDELLAPRALGGLFLLLPAVMLNAARNTPCASRLVLVWIILAYIIAIKGIALVLNPYLMRRGLERWVPNEKACQTWGLAGLVTSTCLVVLALTAYRG